MTTFCQVALGPGRMIGSVAVAAAAVRLMMGAVLVAETVLMVISGPRTVVLLTPLESTTFTEGVTVREPMVVAAA